ncbi:hypothetical protein [Nocardioides astragali]|uniref:Uncharacterized protein n=1 Tax=Nocardioides astragali TaxID=1776736 RepID=A0ABW2MWM2_9ACTN|nr:hypothetical protein [Nocardioides astragali]
MALIQSALRELVEALKGGDGGDTTGMSPSRVPAGIPPERRFSATSRRISALTLSRCRELANASCARRD